MIRGSLALVSDVDGNNIQEILSIGSSALIAFVDENDEESRAVFTTFAEGHQNDFIYGLTSDLSLTKSDELKLPYIVLYNPLDQVQPIFKNTFSVSHLEDFTKKYSTPLIGTFSLETYYAYTEVLLCPLSRNSASRTNMFPRPAYPYSTSS